MKADKIFFVSVIALLFVGIFTFISASLGLLARSGATFSSVVFNHLFFGLVMGSIALFVTSRIHYRHWRKWSFYIFVGSLILTLCVFLPKIGFRHGGAARWIILGPVTFQPAELLKIGYILYLAAWLSSAKERIETFKRGLLPFISITGITAVLMLLQPDTATFMSMFFAGTAMFLVAGGRIRHFVLIGLVAFLGIGILAFQRPYLMQRIETFFNPAHDPSGSSYQVQQSLIAIGSGGVFGRGFGQSVQKFNFLPEPIGDSIFAVAGEEFGLIGGLTIIALFCFYVLRGLKIATRAPDTFGGLVVVGIVILMTSQSFVNIASMLGLMPLSGLPLIFVSHGGTALFCALAEVGIILNISKYQSS